MKASSQTPWVIADALKQELRCERCNDTYALSGIYGKELHKAVAFMRAFATLHSDCKP